MKDLKDDKTGNKKLNENVKKEKDQKSNMLLN